MTTKTAQEHSGSKSVLTDRRDATILDLIRNTCNTWQHKLAVISGDESLTYGNLEQETDRIASSLRALGIGRGATVAICVDRSIRIITGVLGILKSGAAYVPLDPEYPRALLEYMFADCGARFLLTERKLLGTLPSLGSNNICLDDEPCVSFDTRGEAFQNRVEATDLAYIIYTSGSTGRPKGVMVEHGALRNVICSLGEQPGMGSEDVQVAMASVCFDLAGLELFLPLSKGARLVIAPRQVCRDGQQLRRLLEQSEPTVLRSTPARYRMLIEAGWMGGSKLKLACGGEALSPQLAEALMDRAGSVWNEYGPSETTICSTACRVQRSMDPVPIGGPIANTELHVLSEDSLPVPVGEVGELWIGGAGLARGYWNRPELTAERFVNSPVSHGSIRLYRTGDLVRIQGDGNLIYVGRTDGQVKIRGYRVELGEIESTLQKHPSVKQAVAIVRTEDQPTPLLSAFIVPANGISPGPDELRAYARMFLPEHMAPAEFVILSDIPVTQNGKIDRASLQRTPARRGLPECPADPETELEDSLSKVFRNVLRLSSVSPSDSFFDLGGDSLLTLRASKEITSTIGRYVPASAIFETPTVNGLATYIRHRVLSMERALVPIQPTGSHTPLFFIHSPIATQRALAELLGPDQPFYGLQQRGLDGQSKPHTRVEDMASEYVAEILSIQPRGPYRLAGACLGGIVALEIAQQLQAAKQKVDLLMLIDSPFPGEAAHFAAPSGLPNLLWRLDRKLGEILLEARPSFASIAAATRDAVLRVVRDRRRAKALAQLETANQKAVSTYTPRSYPGRITLFWATQASIRAFHDTRLAWAEIADGGLEVYVVPGNHADIIEPPYLDTFAEKLSRCLRSAGPPN